MLIVGGGLALVAERVRPDHFRAIGLVFAFGCTVLFATRDNVVRWLARDSTVPPQLAASATILGGTVLIFVVLVIARRGRMFADIRREGAPFVVPGVLWGASYAFLFEAFYRSRVSVVSPLVATESLFAVLLAVLLLPAPGTRQPPPLARRHPGRRRRRVDRRVPLGLRAGGSPIPALLCHAIGVHLEAILQRSWID